MPKRFDFTKKDMKTGQINKVGYLDLKEDEEKQRCSLYFYGDIVSATWQSQWYEEDKCPQDIADFLHEIDNYEDIDIYFNSGGGDVFAGLAIYNQLRRHEGHKTGYVDGMAASIASVIMFALLLMLIQRAERVLADRMAKNRQLENELHSNEKLVSMGRVIASIAHEIRNPLGIIRSSAELLQRRMGKADAGTSRILQAIYDESVRLSQTVNDFLDYARPRQPRQDLVDLDLVLSQVLAFLEGELGRVGVAIERTTSPGLWVRGDKDLLYRAIYNILVNGQQAMDGPGIIRISSRRSDDGRVVLEALDSGPGFDPALLDSVLDPFFTTKDGGTGLGLPIVSSIINSHGGEIQLANGPEGGALVRILLPAAEPEQPEAPEAPAAAAEAQPAPEESGEAAVRAADDRENGTPEPRKES